MERKENTFGRETTYSLKNRIIIIKFESARTTALALL